mgnify:CR=1 FL=1
MSISHIISYYFNEDSEDTSSVKGRGRPPIYKDTSLEALSGIYDKWERSILNQRLINQRKDARFATIARQIKKLPDFFLKYIGSRCKYKSSNIYEVLKSYLKSFKFGFAPLFRLNNRSDLHDLFIDYMVLCFPESKIQEIIYNLHIEGFITNNKYLYIRNQISWRKKASKEAFTYIYKQNSCFRIITDSLKKSLSERSNNEILRYIIDELTSKDL